MFGTPSNTEREARAERALVDYGLKDDPFAAIVDLLCDVRHYCAARRIGFAEQDRLANDHFLYERKPPKRAV